MQPIARVGILVALATVLVSGAMAPAALAEKQCPELAVFIDEPAAPYALGKMGEQATGGISLELLRELFGRLGMEVELHLAPWARAMKTVRHGKADGLPLLMKSKEREAFLVFSDPVVLNREVLCYIPERIGRFTWQDFSDLAPYTFGLVQGYTYGAAFLEAMQRYGYDVIYSPDAESNLRMLMAGRVDLVVEDETMLRGILAERTEWRGVVAWNRIAVSTYAWHMGISRKSALAPCLDNINRAIKEMREDGALANILSKRQ